MVAWLRLWLFASFNLLMVSAAYGEQSSQKIIDRIAPESWDTPFNMTSQVACHNCYESQLFEDAEGNSLPFRDVLDYVTAIEVDIWDTYSPLSLISSGIPNNWYVRHGVPEDWDLSGAVGNHSNCTPPGSLVECLTDIRDWSNENPEHFPVTLFLDKKQNWSYDDEGRQIGDMFQLLEESLGDKLFSPQDLREFNNRQNTPPGSLTINPKKWLWPESKLMAGKIVVVINGGNFLLDNLSRAIAPSGSTYKTYNSTLSELSLFTQKAAAFSGPYAFEYEDFADTPHNISSFSVFLNSNMSSVDASLSEVTTSVKNHQLLRAWHVDKREFCELASLGVAYAAYYDFRNAGCEGKRVVPIAR